MPSLTQPQARKPPEQVVDLADADVESGGELELGPVGVMLELAQDAVVDSFDLLGRGVMAWWWVS